MVSCKTGKDAHGMIGVGRLRLHPTPPLKQRPAVGVVC